MLEETLIPQYGIEHNFRLRMLEGCTSQAVLAVFRRDCLDGMAFCRTFAGTVGLCLKQRCKEMDGQKRAPEKES